MYNMFLKCLRNRSRFLTHKINAKCCHNMPTSALSSTTSTTTTSVAESGDKNNVVDVKNDENDLSADDGMTEEMVEKLRNVSRMPDRYRNRMLNILEPDPAEVSPDYISAMHQKPALRKLLYAWYGKKSGINPGILWPSESELDEIIEFENEWEPTLQSMLAKLEAEKEAKLKEIKAKEDLIDSRLAKMPQYIKDYQAKLKKNEEQELQLKKKRQQLLDEARDYFGYQISPNDPRFEEMKLAKEEEEKKLLKKKKKEEKLAKAIKFGGST